MKERFFQTFLVTTLLALQVCVVVPLMLYGANADEFSSGFFTLVHWVLVLALLASTAVSAAVICLPDRWYQRVTVVLLAVWAAVYLQSNFMVWQYGVFDGHDINWKSFSWHVYVDSTVWLLLIFLALAFQSWVQRYRPRIVLFVALLSLLQLGTAAASATGKWWHTPVTANLDSLLSFSPQQNVLLIVLDTFQGPALPAVLEAHPDMRPWLDGFTYFQNTLAAFPTTSPSIPALLSGVSTDNTEPMRAFLARVLPQALPSLLFDRGTQVDLITVGHFCQYLKAGSCADLAGATRNNPALMKHLDLAKLADLTLFRILPHALKPFVYRGQRWFFQSLLQPTRIPVHEESLALGRLLEKDLKLGGAASTFKMIHLMPPHAPILLTHTCERRPGNRSGYGVRSYREQSACALRLANLLLEFLKKSGIYDRTLIVIAGDHGDSLNFGHYKKQRGTPAISQGLPLLLVKPFGARGPLATNRAPACLTDLPKTLAEMLGLSHQFSGENLFALKENQARTRLFRHYTWKQDDWDREYLPTMTEFAVQGDAWNLESWTKTRELPAHTQ